MDQSWYYVMVTIALTLVVQGVESDEKQHLSHSNTREKELQDHLFKNHSSYARPVRDLRKAVLVKFGFELMHIVSVVESEQTITQKVHVTQKDSFS